MKKKLEVKSEVVRYTEKETVYFTQAQHDELLKAEKILNFPSRAALLRKAIMEGLKYLDRYIPPENFRLAPDTYNSHHSQYEDSKSNPD